MRPRPPRILAITESRLPTGAELATWAGRLGDAGVEAVQLRAKRLEDRELLAAAMAIRAEASAPPLLVNGRADIAIAADLAGVHLPAAGLAVRQIRRLIGADRWIGRSTHSLEEVDRAAAEGVDYLVFGPIYDTPSKRSYGPPLGVEQLAAACRRGIPVLAIGGVTPERLPEIAATGAYGVAAIRMLLDPSRAATVVGGVRREFGVR